ncbi:HNH endonuclease, partial [Gordonia sp. NPDC003424]
MPDTTSLLSAARDLTITDLTSGRDAFDTTTGLICVSNTVSHRLAVAIAEMDRLGVAAATGGKTRKLLITMG